MGLLKEQKKIYAGQFTKTTMRGTLANAGSTVVGDDILFSGLKKPMMSSSFGNTISSSGNYVQNVVPLKMIL